MKKETSPSKHYFFSPDGNALVLTLVVSIILFIITMVGLVLIRQQSNLIAGSHRKSEALSIAEAGLDAAVWRIEKNQVSSSEITTFNGYNTIGSYDVTVEPSGSSLYEVTSLGEHTATKKKKKVKQDVYFTDLSRAIFSYGGTTGGGGGGQVEGNVNIKGPYYTGGDLNLGGTVGIQNLAGTSGNPLLVRGDLNINSGSVSIGSVDSPMAVFVKGTIDQPDQVFNLVSKQVPEISLPEVVRSQFSDAAKANDNAVYVGDLDLDSNTIQFGQRSDGSYSFEYIPSGMKGLLTVEGVVYIDGSLTLSREIDYDHGSFSGTDYTKATIFVEGPIIIKDEIHALGTYLSESVLALVNEDLAATDDINIDVSGGNGYLETFLYTAGKLTIEKQIEVRGSVIAKLLNLNQVPTLIAPDASAADNYPYLFPGKNLVFITAANWREVSANE